MRLAVVLVLVACSSRAAAPQTRTVVEVRRLACLAAEPPTARSMSVAGPDEGCPDRWAACLDVATVAELARYVTALQRYARDAWIMCGTGAAEEE